MPCFKQENIELQVQHLSNEWIIVKVSTPDIRRCAMVMPYVTDLQVALAVVIFILFAGVNAIFEENAMVSEDYHDMYDRYNALC